MKERLPYIFGGLGIVLMAFAIVLRNGTPDTDTVITNLVSVFMIVAGAVCLLGGCVTWFLRDDPEVW